MHPLQLSSKRAVLTKCVKIDGLIYILTEYVLNILVNRLIYLKEHMPNGVERNVFCGD